MSEVAKINQRQSLIVHDAAECTGDGCPIHAPTDHHMKDWPKVWRWDRGLMERECEHGIGHPDPDHLTHTERLRGKAAAKAEAVHGCCGCCRPPESVEAA